MTLRIVGIVILMPLGLFAAAQQPPQKSTTTQQSRPNPAAAQKQTPNNIGNVAAQTAVGRGASQTPPIPNIHVSADRNSALVGEPVTFTIEPASATNTRYVFTIVAGDFKSGELSGESPSVRHAFKEPGTVSISFSYKLRPIAAVYPPIPGPVSPEPLVIHEVTLTASPSNPVVDQTVTFETPFPSTDSETRYRFYFGDEVADASAPLINEPRSTHKYDGKGTFAARLEVGSYRKGDFSVFATAATKVTVAQAEVPPPITPQVKPPPVSVPVLGYSPLQPKEGETVTFRIDYPPDGTDLVFRVSFGDGSPLSEWSPSPEVSHAYRSSGTYAAHGEVGRTVNGRPVPIANSATISIVVLPPFPWSWILLIAAGATAVAVHQYRKTLPIPNPVLEPEQNRDKSTTEMDEFAIDVQIRFFRNDLNGEFEPHTDINNLITSKRTKHG